MGNAGQIRKSPTANSVVGDFLYKETMQAITVLGAVIVGYDSINGWGVWAKFTLTDGTLLSSLDVASDLPTKEEAMGEAETWRISKRLGMLPILVYDI